MINLLYASKKILKDSIGKELKFQETSFFGAEYPENGTGEITGAHRPHLGKIINPKTGKAGREFFATITLEDHEITKVT